MVSEQEGRKYNSARAMALLGLLALLTVVRSEKDMNFVEEEVSQEQIQYFKEIFMQYDENMDGLISMEENLKQDK
eukprot:140956-Hanusia_phi.AAC.1